MTIRRVAVTGIGAASSPGNSFHESWTSVKKGLSVIAPLNLNTKDPECDLNYVTETGKAEIKTAISNSFGFGGVNAVLAFRKVRG